MHITHKNLLPKKILKEVASNLGFSKIKPRFLVKRFHKLTILGLLALMLLGYQPALTFPPIKQNLVKASLDQTQEIISDELPELSLPHPGYLSTRFSSWHPGIDIATGFGMPIKPISGGVIEQVNFGFLGYGNHIIIRHPKNLKSLYGHMGRVFVKQGQLVSSGDTLGTVGLTGFTSGPHTHLEITRDNKLIDPQTILPKIADYPSQEYLKPVGGNNTKVLHKELKLNP